MRELKEEMGIDGKIENMEYIGMIKQKLCFMDVCLLRQNFDLKDIKFIDGEAWDEKFVSIEELKRLLSTGEAVCDTLAMFDLYWQFNYLE